MKTAREIRPLSREELQRLLSVLELDEVPDRGRLQKHFSQLLKRYHPDRNRERTDWAHEKTRAIIAANHRLRKFLDSERPAPPRPDPFRAEVRVSPAAHPASEPPPSNFDPDAESDAQGFAVQLVRSPLGNFALPVQNLERILGFQPDLVTSLTPGEYVTMYGREVYRTYDLNGDSPRALPTGGYLILFRGRRARFALLADPATRFEQIEECSPRDLRRSFLEGGGELQLFFQTERFIFPARLRRML